jgi:hypothetical protein
LALTGDVAVQNAVVAVHVQQNLEQQLKWKWRLVNQGPVVQRSMTVTDKSLALGGEE